MKPLTVGSKRTPPFIRIPEVRPFSEDDLLLLLFTFLLRLISPSLVKGVTTSVCVGRANGTGLSRRAGLPVEPNYTTTSNKKGADLLRAEGAVGCNPCYPALTCPACSPAA